MIRLTIDDQEISVPEGTLIADAAAKLGIDIPVYCYHEALGPLGACRMCLVQVEKMPKLATACTTAVSEGMVVHTSGPAVDKGRKGVLEFLLINHPLDCPVCDKGGECFLQDYTFQYGPPKGRFEEPKIQKVKDGPINEFILVDQERCVLCQRCVRFMGEYVGERQLLLDGRGVETVVATVDGKPATSQFSGNVIDLCPVGALLSVPYHHKARPWNIEREEAVCTLCPVGCTTLNTGRDGHIVRVEGRPVPDRSWGWLCDRGRFGYDFAVNADRVTGSFLEGHPEAAARTTRQVGQWLSETVSQHGGNSVAFVVGGLHSTEEAYQLNRFAREVVKTDRLAVSRDVPGYLPRGLNGTFQDLDEADAVMLIGTDPYEAVPVVHLRLRDRVRAFPKLKLMGLAPRELARETLAVDTVVTHGGQEAAVLGAALQLVAPEHPAVQALQVPSVDGVGQDRLQALAEVVAESQHLTLLWDGLEADMESVLVALKAVRGDKATRVLPTWGPSNWRGFERAGFSAHIEDLRAILEDAKAGKIQMLVLWGADLLREFPDRKLVEAAYQAVPVLVAESLFPPAGREYFKAILPATAPGEVYGTYVNMEARLQVAMPSVQPPGQARPTKAYITAWAHALKTPFVLQDDWDPYDDNSGDLVPWVPVDENAVNPIQAAPSPEGLEVITGALVIENGIPSDILKPRIPLYPGRISVSDAERLGVQEHGTVAVSRNGETIQVPVEVDPRLTPGRIFIPLGMPLVPVNQIGVGAAQVSVSEEVPSA
ncbi:2Fe-2S iron-sulfur cluster-binding protein [Sulfobacillus harzensis]|uniref:Molybdopterin-dependent oxidoreductase n=1 Tax=Sulfobacillus harzensis TaxID=2729629 RepID=A0A7Y0L4S1_9FIRM|nr:2Fe-2S iron-sulfur cluster-binding protein [Sulfobacillus harzensis]NMP22676.1 molybdopterin-dependent oxidoreductase [Sulfobacillus harzensis]